MSRAILLTCLLVTFAPAAEPTPQEIIAAAARRVVKIYGAGGLRGLEAYQSGLLVSADGEILTAASTVLDSETIACVLDDGRRFTARLVGIDPWRELALLRIDGTDLPAFAIRSDGEPVMPGRRVVALSNMFGVAAGDERVTAQRGVVTAVVPLEARRGVAEAAFRGDVYVLDCTTNNPGSAGGALASGSTTRCRRQNSWRAAKLFSRARRRLPRRRRPSPSIRDGSGRCSCPICSIAHRPSSKRSSRAPRRPPPDSAPMTC
jgi:S1-C subfamily serine protease